jgi:hypothetical protein
MEPQFRPSPPRQQRQPIVDGLQILRLKIHVSPCHLQGGMAQHALQPENVSAIANVIDRETMPEGVG